MKNHLAILLVVFVAMMSLLCRPSWSSVTDVDLSRVFFPTSKVGFVAGKKGAILRTDDGGRTWRPQVSGTETTLNSIYFVGPNKGWACGDQGLLLQTADGGKSWGPADLKVGDPVIDNLHKVFFIGPENGWVCGDHGLLLHTGDGAQTWQIVHCNTRHNLQDMVWVNSLEGWIVGGTTVTKDNCEDVILHTVDGGQTWAVQSSSVPKNYLRSVTFIDARHGWAVGDSIVSTENGGKTWVDRSAGIKERPLYSVAFWDLKDGWIGGAHGALYFTQDGGKSWKSQKSGTARDIMGLFINDDTIGIAVGSADEPGEGGACILHTSNGGKTWEH